MGLDKTFFGPDNQITTKIVMDMDWSNHPLGPPETWPIALKITLNSFFNSKHAVSLFWGKELFYFYNDAYISILGSKKHPSVMGKPGHLVWAEAWDRIGGKIKAVIETGKSNWFADEKVTIEREGIIENAYFTYSYSPVMDEYGVIQGNLIIGVENTKRILAEQALIESRSDLDRILTQAPSGVAFLKGPNLVYSLANSRYKEIFDKDDTLIGQSLREALPDLRPEAYLIFEKVYKTGESYFIKDFKSTVTRKGIKQDVYFSFAIQRILDPQGFPEGVIVIGDDVTEQVNARLSKEQITQHLQAIVHNMAEGLVLSDAKGELLMLNPAACRMHGFKNMKEVSEHIHDYSSLFKLHTLDGRVLDPHEWPMTRALNGETFSGYEVLVERVDSKEQWIGSYSGSPIYDDTGKMIFAVVTLRDVTHRINSERELINAINSRDEFLSIISHELKTPLTSLKLQTQSIIRRINKGNFDDLNPEKLNMIFDKNESQINRLIHLVDDMLDLSRIQSGKLSYNFQEHDLCEVVNEAYERFKEQFENHHTHLVNNCQKSIYGYFDKERIEQVITNLLTNALKYGQGKDVVMNVMVVNNKAQLSIQDHGMGIHESDFEIIFKKFERVVSADEVSGLGIGLFISKQIVEAHHGNIWVESEYGKGSTFIVELPIL